MHDAHQVVNDAAGQEFIDLDAQPNPAVSALARIVTGLLGWLGLRPTALAPDAPSVPSASVLELLYAAWRRMSTPQSTQASMEQSALLTTPANSTNGSIFDIFNV
ncbi:MAG: hypothetical protein K0U84_08280, partial [Actinomycetia bacterium]|nr:hypothetical protein [Actinomycetes bacterium]